MKLFLVILTNFILLSKVYSQNSIEIKVEIGTKRKITKVDVVAADTALANHLTKSITSFVFPKKRPRKGNYTVKLMYIIAKDGSMADVKCVSNPGYGLCEEVIRLVYRFRTWKPATQGNHQML